MRIGINALYLIPGGVGGTEIYLRSLLEAMARIAPANEYFLFVNRESAAESWITASDFHPVVCAVSARNRPRRILWEQFIFPWLLRRYKIDVVFNPGFTMPLLSRSPSVTVFHDLQHRRHPEHFHWFDLPFWNLLLFASARRSRALIAVSEATAHDLDHYYPGVAAKTAVVPHGVDTEFFRIAERRATRGAQRDREKSSADKFLLTVSTLHPHKNIGRLLEAFRIFHAGHPRHRLVIAGLKGRAATALAAECRNLGLGPFVTFTGWIPRPDLYKLFEDADAFVAPSRFEGFGMPIVEALAAGIPSACSAIAPLSDIAGPAAVQFDPESVPAIASAMALIADDVEFRNSASIEGPRQARLFDWEHSAELTLRQLGDRMVTRSVTDNKAARCQ